MFFEILTVWFQIDETGGKFSVGVSAIVRVQLKDGSFHEDIGYGLSDNQRTKGAAIEMAKKVCFYYSALSARLA